MIPLESSTTLVYVYLVAVLFGIGAQSSESTKRSYDLSKSYAPIYVDCPSNVKWVRPADGLAKLESDWIRGRRPVVADALESYLERLQLKEFNVAAYIRKIRANDHDGVPILGMAISGGGWASAFTGTGAIRALDDRSHAATVQRTGGLLQSLSYLSGLSGGSWPTISFATHDFPTADEIVERWYPWLDRLGGAKRNTAHVATAESMFGDIADKAKAGFDVSASDYLGRGFGYEFLPGPHGGRSVTLSGIVEKSKFIDHQMPFPIIQSVGISAGDKKCLGIKIPALNSTVFELTPFEFGAWDRAVNGFTPMEWLGTKLKKGLPVHNKACVRGFDRASFMIGTVAGAFNLWYVENESNGTCGQFAKRSNLMEDTYISKDGALAKRFPEGPLNGLIKAFKKYFHLDVDDIAYAPYPNPFLHFSHASKAVQSASTLQLVDGAESGQGIPLWSQIQPARSPSFIIAWDSDQDGHPYNWNNGTNLFNTYRRAAAAGIPFPIIPPASTIVNRNYSTQPVFFGCDVKLTTTRNRRAPIVLYLANAPYSAYTNFTYSQSMTTKKQIGEIFVNSFDLLTQGNGTLDTEWPACLGCAAVDRSLLSIGMSRTKQCERCMRKYCWDGKYSDHHAAIIDPTLRLHPQLGFQEWIKTHPF